jgi:hypothetical protein
MNSHGLGIFPVVKALTFKLTPARGDRNSAALDIVMMEFGSGRV